MSTVTQIRDALATRLATISGLRAHATHPDTINAPAAVVRPDRRDFSLSMGSAPGAANSIAFVVTLYAASAENGLERGQAALDAYLDDSGSSSIKAAIEGDRTLGGTVTTCRVVRWYDYDTYEAGGIEYVACRFEVEAWP
jgi:hypothetical protein